MMQFFLSILLLMTTQVVAQNDTEAAKNDFGFDEEGNCVYYYDYQGTDLKSATVIAECCDGSAKGPALCSTPCCTAFGYPSCKGTSCYGTQDCDCLKCNWYDVSCFEDLAWHRDKKTGLPSSSTGQVCWGTVAYKDHVTEKDPLNIHGDFCMEDFTRFLTGEDTNDDGIDDGLLYGGIGTSADRAKYKESWKACSLDCCHTDADCRNGLQCIYLASSACATACTPTCVSGNGTCVDPRSPSPSQSDGGISANNVSPFPSATPSPACDCDRYRTEECKALEYPEPWTVAEFPNCLSVHADLEKLITAYDCHQPRPDCETWICNKYIPDYEFPDPHCKTSHPDTAPEPV